MSLKKLFFVAHSSKLLSALIKIRSALNYAQFHFIAIEKEEGGSFHLSRFTETIILCITVKSGIYSMQPISIH